MIFVNNSIKTIYFLFYSSVVSYIAEIIASLLEIFPNKPPEPHKRLTLKRLHEEMVINKLCDNFIKQINLGNYIYEYAVNNKYSDDLTNDELISLLFVYNN